MLDMMYFVVLSSGVYLLLKKTRLVLAQLCFLVISLIFLGLVFKFFQVGPK